MGTNLIRSKQAEEFMSGYTPTYNPMYPIFTGKNSQEYALEVAQRTFKRLEAMGDIRNRRLLAKDTEIKRFNAAETSKVFKAYVNASQFVRSTLQGDEGISDVFAQALEEHQKAQDEILLYGDGTSPSDVVNNALFYSADSNYLLSSTASIASAGRLLNFHQAVVSAAREQSVSGDRSIIFYGSTVLGWLDSLHEDGGGAVVEQLNAVLGNEFGFLRMPKGLEPNGTNGIIIVNHSQIKTHFVAEPQMLSQGVDEKNMEAWANFIQGSMMVEVLSYKGINRVPMEAAA